MIFISLSTRGGPSKYSAKCDISITSSGQPSVVTGQPTDPVALGVRCVVDGVTTPSVLEKEPEVKRVGTKRPQLKLTSPSQLAS